jgi:hypothetical protein
VAAGDRGLHCVDGKESKRIFLNNNTYVPSFLVFVALGVTVCVVVSAIFFPAPFYSASIIYY